MLSSKEALRREKDSVRYFCITVKLFPNVHICSLVMRIPKQKGYMIEIHLQDVY